MYILGDIGNSETKLFLVNSKNRIIKYKNFPSKEINNKVLVECLIKIMKLMIPFTPHLANECLSNLKCKEVNKWPKINDQILENTKINMVVQVNGKTRDVLNIDKNLSEKELNKLIKDSSKANKHMVDKKIIKTIFIKNKIINYIVKN